MQSLSDDHEGNRTSGVIESIIVQPRAIRRHLNAPMLEARETYLAHLIARGYSSIVLRDRAIRICNVIELMSAEQVLSVTDEHIYAAAVNWVETRHVSPKQAKQFIAAARSWFQFLGIYAPPKAAKSHFDEHFAEFLSLLRDHYGYLPSTIKGYGGSVRRFLVWMSSRTDELSQITQLDVDAFLAEKRKANCDQRTIKSYCKGLRTFFRFAERRGWSDQSLSVTISAPNSRKAYKVLECPPWKTVRALIDALDASDPCECRGKAIVLLASLYGMRTCEIIRLTLEDLDWYNEVITIRRAKKGKMQQFPLVFEVGEALIRYLKELRPPSEFRNVFLTLRRPHRPVHNLQQTMRRFMRNRGMTAWPCGLHTLRHACATELLRKGTSLEGIADFLGHRDIRSVSVYAQSDVRALRMVANFSLEGVL
jgi:site-specific recombinase XerD